MQHRLALVSHWKWCLSIFSCVLTLIQCLYHPSVTAVAYKRPPSFCQKCRWQVTSKHAYILDPTKSEWANYAAVRAQCGNISGNKLTHNSSGNTQPQSSQLTEPLWTDPGLKSGFSVHELIFSLKKKKCRQGMNGWTFSLNPHKQGESNIKTFNNKKKTHQIPKQRYPLACHRHILPALSLEQCVNEDTTRW